MPDWQRELLAAQRTTLVEFDCLIPDFGLGTHSRLTYALPAKVYDRFECLVGLHPQLGKGGSLSFRVYADGEAVFDSGVITGDDPAPKLSLSIWRVNELSIDVQSQNATLSGGFVLATAAHRRG